MFLQCCFKVVVVKGKYVLVLLQHRVECFLNRLLSPLYNVVWLQKEEVETALRSSNMILEDALDLLNMSNNWRGRHNDLEPPFEHMNPPFPTQRFNPQQIPFAPPVSTEPPSRSLLSLSLSLSVSPSLSISAFRFWVFRGWFLPSTVVKLMIWCVVWIWSVLYQARDVLFCANWYYSSSQHMWRNDQGLYSNSMLSFFNTSAN